MIVLVSDIFFLFHLHQYLRETSASLNIHLKTQMLAAAHNDTVGAVKDSQKCKVQRSKKQHIELKEAKVP